MYKCIVDPRKLTSSIGLLNTVLAHTKTCPTMQVARCPGSGKKETRPDPCQTMKIVRCPGSVKKGGGGGGSGPNFGSGPRPKRALKSGLCRFGFLPDEWFTFFYPLTGVSGPYIFGIVLGNYLLSKEIYIMEHEYYSGLSIALVCYLVVTKFGPTIGKALDREVDAIAAEYQKTRTDEMAVYENAVKAAKLAQEMAKGQELLIAAKKENIKIQLEAAYRERMMHVYNSAIGRMDYHVDRQKIESRIHQKWMIEWILDQVMKSITPQFEQQALDSAIRDLLAVAGQNAKK